MNDVLPTLRKILGWTAAALAIVALLKMFRFHGPGNRNVEANAMVAAGLALARI